MPQTVDPTHCYKCKRSAREVKVYKSQGWCYDCNKEYQRWAHIARKYGVTRERFEEMLFVEQHGKCKICDDEITTNTAVVDHSHLTGSVRGLLCSQCNVGLGNFKDSPDIIQAALDYLDSRP